MLLDTTTNFIIKTKVIDNLERGKGLIFLQEAKRQNKLKMKALLKDGGMMFGNLFTKRGYNQVKVHLCKVHMKWLTNRYLKQYCGMNTQSKKPLPDYCIPIRDQYYRLLDASHETDMFAAIEALKATTARIKNKYLIKGFNRLQAQLPRLLNHLKDPWLPRTNNKLENLNQFLERNPSVKRQMKSMVGIQHAVNYRVIKHNLMHLLLYKIRLDKKYQQWLVLHKENDSPSWVKYQAPYFCGQYRKFTQIYTNYINYWEKNIAIIRDN